MTGSTVVKKRNDGQRIKEVWSTVEKIGKSYRWERDKRNNTGVHRGNYSVIVT